LRLVYQLPCSLAAVIDRRNCCRDRRGDTCSAIQRVLETQIWSRHPLDACDVTDPLRCDQI